MKTYIISLSMGHDTNLKWHFCSTKAESVHQAVNKIWDEVKMFSYQNIEAIYESKGIQYFPYYFVHEIIE